MWPAALVGALAVYLSRRITQPVLELSDGVLVPFVSDAIRSVQPGEIVVNEGFLG
jgi:hypothetical protein